MTEYERTRADLLGTGGDRWWQAPLPRRWHRCRAWTMGRVDGALIMRCACGGFRFASERFWMDRNSRRKMAKWTGGASENEIERQRAV